MKFTSPLARVTLLHMLTFTSCRGSLSSSVKDVTPPASPAKISHLSAELKTYLSSVMKSNMATFQEQKILDRLSIKRPPTALTVKNQSGYDVSLFETCGIPRKPKGDGTGDPLPMYDAVAADAPNFTNVAVSAYKEAEIVKCLSTKTGLAGTMPSLLQLHYYCSLPGFSPDIRSCFTFQSRVSSETRSAVDDDALTLQDGAPVVTPVEKHWTFVGTDADKAAAKAAGVVDLRIIGKAMNYCLSDGRPSKALISGSEVPVTDLHAQGTRPMCFVAMTQAKLFQMIMGGFVDVPQSEQIDFLKTLYNCDFLKANMQAAKISQSAYDAYCEL